MIQQKNDRLLPLWELITVVVSCLIVEWVVLSFVGNSKLVAAIPAGLALALMLFSHHERHESARDVGFRLDNFIAACRLLLLPTLIICCVVVGASWWMRGHEFAFAPLRLRFLSLPLWALFQQYALQGFMNRRAQLCFGPGFKSIILVAAAFSLLHLPNPLLTIATLVGGLLWAAVYQRQPNLFASALSHSIGSLILALSVPPHLVNSLRVGLKYFG